MTPRMRMLTYVTASTLVLGSLVGCGLLGAAKKLANNAVLLGNLSEKITNAEKLTYKAVYKATDGTTDTIEQAPPKVAYLSSDSDWIFDGNTIYSCDKQSGAMTCTKTVETDSADPEATLGLGAGGFFTGGLGIALLAAALIVPQTNVKTSNKTIAGLSGTCVDASGVDQGDSTNDDIVGFSMCVADNGVVTDFEGTYKSGKKDGITLQTFSTSVDSSAFAPPAGATITDLSAPQAAPPTTTESLVPSAPAPTTS